MKKVILLLLIIISYTANAQFRYSAWNLGIQTGGLKITNAFSTWQSIPTYNNSYMYKLTMSDSADASQTILNGRFNIEVLRTNAWVKAGFSFPLAKVKRLEYDNAGYYGRHMEVDLQAAYGFKIRDVVGFQFGGRVGVFNIGQKFADDTHSLEPDRIDYFHPPNTGSDGEKYFGIMSVWQAGLLVSNIIAFSDKMALRTTYSHNNLSGGDKDRNDQLDIGFYYSNPDWHNAGINIGFVKNWISSNGDELEDPIVSMGGTKQIYPVSKISLATFYIGLNVPISFGD